MTSPKRLAALGGAAPPVYIEDVFSAYLYAGNSSTQTITNNIDLSGKGGLVWIKSRTITTNDHNLTDTNRGIANALASNNTNAQTNLSTRVTAVNADGFTLGSNAAVNSTGHTFVSWTFRKQAKFFDVVTYTGNGANRTISHNLGSVPGCIVIKRTDTTGNWQVYHRSLTSAANSIQLNLTNAQASATTVWNSTAPTSTVFSVGTDATVNANAGTYVAYLFAHDAGGFGATGNGNVISCGSYVGDGTTTRVVSLGYEPQWILLKRTNSSSEWFLFDTMRGMDNKDDYQLLASTNGAEGNYAMSVLAPTATGFTFPGSAAYFNTLNENWIYIAIRRGPMKTPTSGTSVFAPVTRAAVSTTVTSNTNPDLIVPCVRNATSIPKAWLDKLRGKIAYLDSTTTSTEYAGATATLTDWGNTGVLYNSSAGAPANDAGKTYVDYFFTRAPGFFDVVCYTGDGVAGRTVTHNLSAKPLINMVKRRDVGTGSWTIYTDLIDGSLDFLQFDTTAKQDSAQSVPTSTVFSVSNGSNVNANGSNYVAYLFGNVDGVSKCGVYTGTGAAQTINCGFSAGARFVMIKRTDSTGNWYVWDTARGIISGNDPYLFMNSTAAEVTNTDYLSVQSSGFGLTASAPAALNANGGTYLYLAIA